MTGYNQHTSDHNEPGSIGTVEEEFIREALKAYREERNYRSWCTIADLHRVYAGAWMARNAPYPGDPDPILLNVRQFGAALNAIFPNTIPVTRRVGGVATRGRACLVGPVALEIKRAGRPRKET